MNRNEIIGTVIGKTLGYAIQGFVYSEVANAINSQSAILIKTGTKYGIRFIKYTSKNYVRTNFKSETIFSDTGDASFLADVKKRSLFSKKRDSFLTFESRRPFSNISNILNMQ